jgi:hypothetical protein
LPSLAPVYEHDQPKEIISDFDYLTGESVFDNPSFDTSVKISYNPHSELLVINAECLKLIPPFQKIVHIPLDPAVVVHDGVELTGVGE